MANKTDDCDKCKNKGVYWLMGCEVVCSECKGKSKKKKW